MEAIKAKLGVWAKDKALVRLAAACLAVLLILLICLCISIHMRTNIQKKYSSAVDAMQQQAYRNLSTMTQLFARVDDPNVDVRYKLIPELKAQYASASALCTVLNAYAPDSKSVLSQEELDAFDAAFDLYAEAYRSGSATGLAQADMGACIARSQELVEAFYAPEEDEEDEVVVINASSGKIENPKDEN